MIELWFGKSSHILNKFKEKREKKDMSLMKKNKNQSQIILSLPQVAKMEPSPFQATPFTYHDHINHELIIHHIREYLLETSF